MARGKRATATQPKEPARSSKRKRAVAEVVEEPAAKRAAQAAKKPAPKRPPTAKKPAKEVVPAVTHPSHGQVSIEIAIALMLCDPAWMPVHFHSDSPHLNGQSCPAKRTRFMRAHR